MLNVKGDEMKQSSFKKYTEINDILVAIDIVAPFSHKVNIKNLGILLNRINKIHAYDKVGDTFYKIHRNFTVLTKY